MTRNETRKAGVWFLCAGLLLLGSFAQGQEALQRLWQIGNADSSTKDLALGPNGYARFSTDPLFVVGRSKPRENWPYAHPGPSDAWAGSRSHRFLILFNVADLPQEMEGKVVLQLLLYDSHETNPPRIAVSFNGETKIQRTPPGAGDASIAQGGPGRPSRLSFEFPVQRLRPGTNLVEINNDRGSWFLYDALEFLAPAEVRLGPAPAYYRIERVEDTVLQRRQNGRPTQVVRLHVLASADRPASVALSLTTQGFGWRETISQTVSIRPGRQWLDVDIPRQSGWPINATAALAPIDGFGSTATTTVRSHRQWTVYLIPHSHVDIGYTDVQTTVSQQHKQFLADAMDFVEQHPEYAGDARFCWNVEVLWAVKDFLRNADAAQRDRFLRHVRNGSIGLDALFANELTGLCTSEEMARLVQYAGQLVRDYGLQIDSAMITDVPGYSWGLPAVLGEAGIRYFDMGPNGSARIGSVRRVWRDKPFYWVAPDSRHRVLTWLSPYDYCMVFQLLRNPEGVQQLLSYLGGLEANPDYPYNIARSRMCIRDNGPPPLGLSQIVRDWNARYESPRLIIGRAHDAFAALEREFGGQIPSYTGDFSPYWEDGAGSSADETRRNRWAVQVLEAAEKIWSAARVVSGLSDFPIPLGTFDQAWDNALLYDEHTWGAHNSISDPDLPFVWAQWKIKQAFALDAERQAAQLLGDGLAALARNVPTGADPMVLVFNPCSWKRTDLVRVEVPSSARMAIADSRGRTVPTVRSDDGRSLSFVARDVPPLGYRTYRLAPADKVSAPSVETPAVDFQQGRLQSRFFSLALDSKTASVARIAARRGGLRGERTVARDHFNGFLYCKEGSTTAITGAQNATIEMAKPESPDGAALLMRSPAPGCRSLTQKIEVHNELPWIDIANTLERDDVRQAEGLYFDFPFPDLAGATIRFDTAWAPVRLEDDLLPGACKNWFCVQNWVEVSNRQQTVVLAPMDAPFIEIGEIHPNTRHHVLPEIGPLRLNPPRILSFVMNNYWFTNYRASQPGTTTFRYRLYRYDGPSDPVQTARYGAEARQPLLATVVKANNKGSLPADAHGFVQVEPDHVMVTAIIPTASGETLIRLHEIAGERARVTLTAGRFGNVAERVDLWGRRLYEVRMRNGQMHLEVNPREIVTVRIGRKP